MIRRLLWAGVTAVAMILARRLAARIWRGATGEEPPARSA
jgi:hypothetical protein